MNILDKPMLNFFLKEFKNTLGFKKLVPQVKNKKEIYISNVFGSAFPVLLTCLQANTSRSYLIIASEETIEELIEDLLSLQTKNLLVFSDKETLKDEDLPSYAQVSSQRILSLVALSKNQKNNYVIITTPEALQKNLPLPSELKDHIRTIELGQKIDIREFLIYLNDCGYSRADQVMLKGDFSARGGIIDIYCPVSENPVRIELDGDKICSIREFDPSTQLSLKKLQTTTIVAAKESSVGKLGADLFDYLPKETTVFINDIEKNLLAPEILTKISTPENSVIYYNFSNMDPAFNPIEFSLKPGNLEPTSNPKENRVQSLVSQIKELRDHKYKTLLLAEYPGQAQRIQELLKEYEIFADIADEKKEAISNISICILNLSRGWIDPNQKIAVIVLKEIFSVAKNRRSVIHKARLQTTLTTSEDGFKNGDIVVHFNYGIGLFRGLKTIPVENIMQDFFLIEYADSNNLYIPLDQLNLLSKYIGKTDPPPPLSRLGSNIWQNTRKRAKQSILDYAKELLELYAWRRSIKGFAFSKDTHWQEEFELGFPYEETPDQIKTTNEIKQDMEKDIPTDRLLCGDVGYGKTEVAMRAAFKAVMDGKQVAVLVPTTILADQHFLTFSERMATFPVKIDVLSRFRSKEEQKKTVKELAEGKIDIIIGTHRLIQNDIKFSDIGLLIIDEEQRFGVLQKEYLKKLRKKVDVLAMTATPIPRTLHMSLSGIRDISIIETPPSERVSIKTFVSEFNPELIRKAALREMERKGQIFYVHNRIQTMEIHERILREILPQARIAKAHGQMHEQELENIMTKFFAREFDILLSTDIIGAGLDIANANTIIITDAQDFGLAQMYQLRGRVGRTAGHQAYAYVFYNPGAGLTEQSRKRLNAISEFVELGSGLRLALRDLEIRGAGNILGKDQHGQIQSVGMELYSKMLEETVSELKGEPLKEKADPVIDIGINAYIPDTYITATEQKIIIYKKMSRIKDQNEIKALKNELIDRYGPIPEPILNLFELLEIKLAAKRKNVLSIQKKRGITTFFLEGNRKINIENASVATIKNKLSQS